jgi:hypothetical protein
VPFQLRRMVLVNAGTNKHVASGRITEVDPRGGAAVVGDNAVGKTFTLRLIPLFFGHPTRDLVALDKGQEGASFIFPSPTSAVCFEYQRENDDPENLRLVVMRARADGSDAPEYRIFPCSFRKELFVHQNHFLSDEGTEATARALGIAPTKKMTTSEYRSVILRFGYSGHDAKKLHAYALANSFSNKPLPNLDKLVATMVKRGIRFEELVAVAVGLIQDDLGLETQRGTLKMRQQRGDLDRWMRNLDAARKAVALGPRIESLRGLMLELTTAERQWRERRHDVNELVRLRTGERTKVDADLREAEQQRQEAAKLERDDIREKEGVAQAAGQESKTAKAAYEEARDRQVYFAREEAERWAKDQAREEPLRHELSVLDVQRRTLQASANEVHLAHSEAATRLERAAGHSIEALEKKKGPLREQFEADISTIDESERQAAKAIDDELDCKRETLDTQRQELDGRAAECNATIANPSVAPELSAAVKTTSDKLIQLGDEAEVAGGKAVDAGKTEVRAQRAFEASEQAIALAKRRVREAEESLKATEARMKPESGTLLSALRTHGDEAWKRDVAKVLNPALLARTDLRPHALPEGGESLYGWMLDVAAIELPPWADDEGMRQELTRAEAALESARRAQADAEGRLSGLGTELEAAKKLSLEAEAEVSVVKARRKELGMALHDAEVALARGRLDVVTRAQGALRAVETELAELRRLFEGLKVERERRIKEVRHAHETQRQAARKRRDDGIEALDISIQEVGAQKREQLEVLQAQLQEQLRRKGIDPMELESLQTRIQAIEKQLDDLGKRKPLVEAYAAWMRNVGPDRVVVLERQAADLAQRAAAAAGRADAAKVASRNAQTAHDEQMEAGRARGTALEGEVNKLTPLLELFEDYLPSVHDRVDGTMKADEMRRLVREQQRALKEMVRELTDGLNHCLRELTMTESTVKQLIEGSMVGQAGSGVLARTATLAEAYRRLPEQVIGELNNSLGTILNQIAQFRRRIVSFESEVGKFNTKLQKALGEITRFERLADLKLNIVADFRTLDFYGKLGRMDEVMRRQQSNYQLSGTPELPPNETVEALRDFMGVLGAEGLLEVDLAKHIGVHGSVVENGRLRTFKSSGELVNISSTGLTTLILITLLVGLVHVVRRGEPVHVPWVTDEVGTFDPGNFKALLELLKGNGIDVITASPALDKSQLKHFAQRYIFRDRGEICLYQTERSAA